MARRSPETWSAATQPAPARFDAIEPTALRRADSVERAEDAAAHVANKSKTLFARLFRLRGRLSSANSLDPSPARHPVTAIVNVGSGPAVASGRGLAQPSHAPVAALFRSLHLRGKSVSSDDAADNDSNSGASDSNGPPASDTAAGGRRNGRGRRLVEQHARAPPVPRPAKAPADKVGVLMESELTKVAPHRYWHSKHAYFVLEEDSSSARAPDAMAATRIVLRQYRKAEDARANRLELLVSQIALSELDVVRDLRQDPQLKHGLELLFVNAEECPEVSIWSSAAATLAPRTAPLSDRDTGLHSLRLMAGDAATHSRWLRVLAASISRLIVQSHKHYPNDSPLIEQRHRVVVPRDVGAEASRLQNPRSMEETGCSPIRAKVAPIQYYSTRHVDRHEADAAAKDGRVHADRDSYHATGDSENQVAPWHNTRGSGAATAVAKHQGGVRRRLQHSDETPNGSIGEDGHRDCEHECKHGNNSCGQSDSSDGNQAQTEDEAEDNQEDDARSDTSGAAPEFVVYLTPSDPGSESTVYQGSEPEQRELNYHHGLEDGDLMATASEDVVHRSGKVAPAPSYVEASDLNDDADSDESDNNGSVKTIESDGSSSTGGHGASTSSAPPNNRGSFGAHFLRSDMSTFFPFQRSQTHTFNAGGQVFTLDTRYRLLKSVGNGAYGAVIAVKDAVADENVAVKKITNIFEDLVDAKRILREVRLLRHFDHKNITRLLDLAPPPSKKHFEDMYIITELMETDLHQVIYSMQPMSDDHVKYFLYQMLCALHHIHSAGVLHRDMKPSNILLNSNCDLKICDFGLARGGLHSESSRARSLELTEYVVTRWYRAPEIMLNCLHYTEAIDVWAVGCIFAEMLLREPLFPGNDYIHQLKLIVKFLGTPKQEDIAFVKNVKALRFLAKLSISKPKKWRDVFAGHDVNPLAVDLLTKMLMFNPAKRISVEDALRHPYLATFYDEVDIKASTPFDFSFDLPDDQLSRDALVDLLCEDVEHFHPSISSLVPPPPPAVSSAGSRFFRLGMTASAS